MKNVDSSHGSHRQHTLTDAVDCQEHSELFWFEPSEFKSTMDALNEQNR